MNKAKPIYNTFLKDLDKFLGENLGNLTCADIREMYFDFYWELKNFKGNSSGFTGLSEYIIFRLIDNLLGGSFEKKELSANGFMNLYQRIRFIISGKTRL